MTTKKLNKTQQMAQWAKDKGYEYIATVVKRVYDTEYFNVSSIDGILREGRIIGAPYSGYHNYRIGTIASAIDWRTTIRRTNARMEMAEEIED